MDNQSSKKKKSQFYFINAWTSMNGFDDCVKTSWRKEVIGTLMFRLFSKTKETKKAIQDQNMEKVGNIHDNVSFRESYALQIQGCLDCVPYNVDLQEKAFLAQQHAKEAMNTKKKVNLSINLKFNG